MLINQYSDKYIKAKILTNYINNGGALKHEDIDDEFKLNSWDNKNLSTYTSRGYVKDEFGVGVLKIEKINIKEIINFPVDISDFEVNQSQIERNYFSDLSFIDQYDTDLVISRGFAFAGKKDYDKFDVFCSVVGLIGISNNDVKLTSNGNILRIEFEQRHPFYYGVLEIKTW